MKTDPLVVETHGKVALWRMSRPEVRNALSDELKLALEEKAHEFINNDSLKCVVLTGVDRVFCAGGDLRTMDSSRRGVDVRKRLQKTYRFMKLLTGSEKVVIMAVNGAAVGAGLALALTGDIIIASDQAYFMSGYSRVGVLPDLALLYNLPRAIGMPRAKDLMMTNERISAAEALSMGLVSRVVPHDEILERAMRLAGSIADGPSVSLGLTKSLLNLGHNDSLEEFLLREETGQAVVFDSDDFAEGNRAFKEKREPRFQGR
jgi:2-(1,2-epoxy-1,2-dihydrophenyl)acetyl-CoA isomerase